jgi:hypothetical protein
MTFTPISVKYQSPAVKVKRKRNADDVMIS